MPEHTDKAPKPPSPDTPLKTPKTALAYGKAIESYRTHLDISQEELSLKCGLGRNAINEIEGGKRKKIQRGTVSKIVVGLNALGLEITVEEFDDKAAEYEEPDRPKLDHQQTPYTENEATGRQDLANIAHLIPSARLALEEIGRRTNSEVRIVEGIGLILDTFQQFAGQARSFETSRFGLTMEALDSFLQEIEKKELNSLGSLFSLGDLKRKLTGFQEQLGKYYSESKDGLVPNGWPQDELKHYYILQELLAEIQVRKSGIEAIQNIKKRDEALDTLMDLEIQLRRNPLHLKNINSIRARLEELDRDIFKELLISSQLLLGTYAELLTPGSVFRDTREAPEMVVIPAGEFLMGSAEGEGHSSERPQHKVTIPMPIAISRYPVIFEEWDRYRQDHLEVHNHDDKGWGRERRPVMRVSWDDTKGFLEWLEDQTKMPYRLLSEAEWEYACRAGTDTEYHFGDDEGQLKDYAWHSENSESKTQPVGLKKPNQFGLYDMHGNVWEWCVDHWYDDYNGAPEDGSARTGNSDKNADEKRSRVLRGGSWGNLPEDLRARNRVRDLRGVRDVIRGFRVARALASNQA